MGRVAALVVAMQLVAVAGVGCASTGDGPKDEKPATAEALTIEPLPYWGLVQMRADDAFDRLEEDVGQCLEELEIEQTVPSMTVRAQRRAQGGADYAVVSVEARPAEASSRPCVERVLTSFVEAVGPGEFDDFEVYMATFIGRPERGGKCDEHGEVGQNVCVDLGSVGADGGDDGGEGECPESLVEAVNDQILRPERCRQVPGFHDVMNDYGDEGHALRAVIFGDLYIDDGRAQVVMHYDRPPGQGFAQCMTAPLESLELEAEGRVRDCQSPLRNHSIVLWHRPWFIYVVD